MCGGCGIHGVDWPTIRPTRMHVSSLLRCDNFGLESLAALFAILFEVPSVEVHLLFIAFTVTLFLVKREEEEKIGDTCRRPLASFNLTALAPVSGTPPTGSKNREPIYSSLLDNCGTFVFAMQLGRRYSLSNRLITLILLKNIPTEYSFVSQARNY